MSLLRDIITLAIIGVVTMIVTLWPFSPATISGDFPELSDPPEEPPTDLSGDIDPTSECRVVIRALTDAIDSGTLQGDELATIYFLRSQKHEACNDLQRANADFLKASMLKADSLSAETLYQQAHLQAVNGKLPEAANTYQSAQQLGLLPKYSADLGLGCYSYDSKNFQKCLPLIAAYKKIGLIDEAVQIYEERAMALKEVNLDQEAVESYSEAIKLAPTNSDLIWSQTIHCEFAGLNDCAIAGYNKLLNLSPNDYDVLYRRGLLFGKLGQCDKAKEDFAKIDFGDALENVWLNASSTEAYDDLVESSDLCGGVPLSVPCGENFVCY